MKKRCLAIFLAALVALLLLPGASAAQSDLDFTYTKENASSAPGIMDGRIVLTITGGTAPYNIYLNGTLKSDPNIQVESGYHTVMVEDAVGDTVTKQVLVGASDGSFVYAMADSYDVFVGETAELDVLANDVGYESHTLTIETQPSEGSANVVGDKISFTAGNTVGTTSFTYKIKNGDSDESVGTVQVNVRAYPVPVVSGWPSNDTLAVGEQFTLTPDLAGGTWAYDAAFWTFTQNSPATFTARKAGQTTISYTRNGQTVSRGITIGAPIVSALPEEPAPTESRVAETVTSGGAQTGDADRAWLWGALLLAAAGAAVAAVLGKRAAKE